MAGVTDLAFREICKEYGADVTCSEMVSAKALCYNSKKTELLFRLSADRPAAVQIFGHEPDFMAKGAEIVLAKAKPDFLDINFGCPAPKIVKNGDGCAVMKTPETIGEIVCAVVAVSDVPVTVKLRAGFYESEKNAVLCAKIAEQAGAAAITIHGRTREQYYLPSVDYEIIEQVKKAVFVPVIGNGDIIDKDSFDKMKKTGVDSVMIGRGALGNPFIFAELKGAAAPDCEIRLETACRHIERLVEYRGERIGMAEARKHFCWYIKGFRGGANFRREANKMEKLDDLYRICEQIRGDKDWTS